MELKRTWHAIYTKPRWEKKVHKMLSDRGFESYCPLNKIHRKWSDRIKLIEEPLFKSYVFVCVDENSRTGVRMVDGVINFVYWNGKPAVVTTKEIEDIRRFLHEYEDVELEQMDLLPESQFLIRSGLMMDRKATVKRVLHNRVEVEIESLGCRLVAFVDRANLKPLPK